MVIPGVDRCAVTTSHAQRRRVSVVARLEDDPAPVEAVDRRVERMRRARVVAVVVRVAWVSNHPLKLASVSPEADIEEVAVDTGRAGLARPADVDVTGRHVTGQVGVSKLRDDSALVNTWNGGRSGRGRYAERRPPLPRSSAAQLEA